MNRLNLMHMVNRNIPHYGEMKFFDSTEIELKDYHDSEKYNTKIEIHRKQNIEEKANQLMAQVQNQLHMNSRKASLPKPAIKIEKLKEKSPAKIQKKKKKITLSDDQTKCNSLSEDNTGNKEFSMPCTKANICKKAKHTAPPAPNNFNSQKQIEDMLHHNAALENMLEEHRQLRQDRQSIANEINVMRGSLDGIRVRLKSSIKKLDDKKTYCDLHGLLSYKSCKDQPFSAKI